MMGFDLSPGTLIAGTLVSSVGFGLYLYGKRSSRFPQLLAGLALMGFPMFVHGVIANLVIGAGTCAGLWAWGRLGA